MLQPQFIYDYSNCRFSVRLNRDPFPMNYEYDVLDFIIPSIGKRTEIFDGRERDAGDIAVYADGIWHTEQMQIARYPADSPSLQFQCHSKAAKTSMAFPIDPSMTRADIEGATIIEPNASNTAWIFKHTQAGNHHDHEIRLAGDIDGIFQPVFRLYLTESWKAGLEEISRQRYTLLTDFYSEVLKEAKKISRGKHLGERHKDLHPEAGHLHTEILTAYNTVKAKWDADSAKADAITKLTSAFAYISGELAMVTPETRWDRAARLAREAEEAKKKAAAEAETLAGDGSSS